MTIKSSYFYIDKYMFIFSNIYLKLFNIYLLKFSIFFNIDVDLKIILLDYQVFI